MPRTRKEAAPESHSAAVTLMLTATGLLAVPDEAPLVMLVKTLAEQMDADPSSTRTQQAYLSALKDLRRVLNAAAAPPKRGVVGKAKPDPEPEEPPAPKPAEPDNLLRFEQKHGLA